MDNEIIEDANDNIQKKSISSKKRKWIIYSSIIVVIVLLSFIFPLFSAPQPIIYNIDIYKENVIVRAANKNLCETYTFKDKYMSYKVEVLDDYMFCEDSTIQEVTVGKYVKEMKTRAFADSPNLLSVKLTSTIVPRLGWNCFTGVADDFKILVPATALDDFLQACDSNQLGWSKGYQPFLEAY